MYFRQNYLCNVPTGLTEFHGPLYVKWIMCILESIQVNKMIVVEDIYEYLFWRLNI